ncbi:MAG: hydroxyacylglutathione hydrolase [Alphaproteobacteria bacterium]|nr:MAG: hydroxyacylglutathione hydrolase [Alphaproteobacteria bacterium]
MTVTVMPVPALRDNYIWLLGDPAEGTAAIVDPPEAGPALAALRQAGLRLETILNTHHHWDHVGGIGEVKDATAARVFGPPGSAARIPVDAEVGEGERITVLGRPVEVLAVPGHTLDHIAYVFPEDDLLLCGDTLFAMGCGRIFEGTPEMMWSSLDRLRQLPGRMRVCCAHEYTLANGRFALGVEPGNPDLVARMKEVESLRRQGRPTLPSTIALERATNPFLRPESPEIRARLGLEEADNVTVFARLRALKDRA